MSMPSDTRLYCGCVAGTGCHRSWGSLNYDLESTGKMLETVVWMLKLLLSPSSPRNAWSCARRAFSRDQSMHDENNQIPSQANKANRLKGHGFGLVSIFYAILLYEASPTGESLGKSIVILCHASRLENLQKLLEETIYSQYSSFSLLDTCHSVTLLEETKPPRRGKASATRPSATRASRRLRWDWGRHSDNGEVWIELQNITEHVIMSLLYNIYYTS